MNTKIKTEIALGIILVISSTLGYLFYFSGTPTQIDQSYTTNKVESNPIPKNTPAKNTLSQKTEQPANSSTISDNIKDKCQPIKNCDKDCLGGWSYSCLYDKNKNKESDFKLGFQITPKESCFAVKFESVCGECERKFEINKDGNFIEATCEEFYQAIENKNKECNNCLEEIITAS